MSSKGRGQQKLSECTRENELPHTLEMRLVKRAAGDSGAGPEDDELGRLVR